ncbi:hypothetical protein V6N13_092674 [Hibiscus sabdariffa]
MNSVKWLIRMLLIFFLSHFSISADTITLDHFIQDDNDEVIVSDGNRFALGFFSPGISTNRYVGIWYYQVPVKTPVWVANRDNPINDTSGVLRIDGRGNLSLFQGNQTLFPVWSTNISTADAGNSFAQILDSGNLVLIQNDTGKAVLWQSFGYPTDTWLSLMKIGFSLRTGLNQSYTSWKSPDDPGVGNISFRMNPGVSPQMVLYKGSVPVWRSGSWTGKIWSGIPEMTQNVLFNDSFVNIDDEVSFSSDTVNASLITRYVTNETGVTHRILWNDVLQRWITSYSAPIEQCDFYGHCGPNGFCNPYLGHSKCTCFPGFEPKLPQTWLIRAGSGGCVRKRGISICGNGEGFVKIPHAKVPDTSGVPAFVDMSIGLVECEENCLSNCSCMAYASANSDTDGGVGCLTWHGDLVDSRAFTKTGQDLYIRVDKSELKRHTKGLLKKKGVLAIVIVSSALVLLVLVTFLSCWVQRQRSGRTRKGKDIFSIKTFEDSLSEKDIEDSTGNGDLPYFDLTTIAAATNDFSSEKKLGQGGFGPVYKVWELWEQDKALEVVDSTLVDSYSTDEILKCIQIGLLCVQENATRRPTMSGVVSMLSKEATLPVPEPPAFIEKKGHNGHKIWNSDGALSLGILKKKAVLAVIIVSSAVVCLILVALLRCIVRRQRRGEMEIDESTRNIDFPFFGLSTIAAATNNFSSDNKLGQGGFGPLYKVVFLLTTIHKCQCAIKFPQYIL